MSDGFRNSEYDDNNMNMEDKEYGNNRHTVGGEQIQKEAEEENKEKRQEKEEALTPQENEACEEGLEDSKQEKKAGEKEGGDQEKDEDEAETSQINSDAQRSCSYKPPYYAPNFTENGKDGKADKKDGKKRKKENVRTSKKSGRSFGAVTVALVVALALIVTTVLPTLLMNVGLLAVNGFMGLGNIIDGLFSIEVSNSDSSDDVKSPTVPDSGASGEMNVIKNDGTINVTEQLGSTGYTDSLSISQVVELVADTVVEITTTNVVTDRFYGQYVTSGAGSGVIISENGYIITNNHVIDGAQRIYVRLTDGSEFEAKLIGGDAEKDIALIKINATGLKAAVMGSSKSLVVGQEVVAIGNPLGSLGGTVTDGIISALDRTVVVDGHQMTLMQTNAAINPGNSGGGLFNRAGELIGIVNAKQSDTGIEGLGFAIPIDIAWDAAKTIADGYN